MIAVGTTTTLRGEYRDGAGSLVDPVTPRLSILDPAGAVVVAPTAPVRDSLGLYHYDYAVPLGAPTGTYTARWTGTVAGAPVSADEAFDVVAAFGVLATVDELETLLGRVFTATEAATAQLVLDMASAAIRSRTGQQFTVATSTVALRARRGKVRLPQRPVTAVSAVTDTATPPVPVTFVWDRFDSLLVGRDGTVLVTYTHGDPAVPDDIGAVALAVARRGFEALLADMESETIGAYSYKRIAEVASEAMSFTEFELAILDSHRRTVGVAWLS